MLVAAVGTVILMPLGVPLTLGVTWVAASWLGRADASRHRKVAP
jgi:hypothetical protein